VLPGEEVPEIIGTGVKSRRLGVGDREGTGLTLGTGVTEGTGVGFGVAEGTGVGFGVAEGTAFGLDTGTLPLFTHSFLFLPRLLWQT
jgi:hypothetical protein